MSRRIFQDTEEAISREVRRITFNDQITPSKVVLQDSFDPFTGELVQVPIEPSFYDSSADTSSIQYPHFFIRLMKTREDRFTGRVVPEYGQNNLEPVTSAPTAYTILTLDTDGLIPTIGNQLTTNLFQIRKVQPNQYIRLLSGNNIGTYIVDSVSITDSGSIITVSNTLTNNLPEGLFDSISHKFVFRSPTDLNTVQINDTFVDSTSVSFNITAIDIENNIITLSSGTPSTASGASIVRSGNVFKAADASYIRFLILDPTAPILKEYSIPSGLYEAPLPATAQTSGRSSEIPLDLFYMVRIDSKDRLDHINIINRIWEEFNPPRTALPIVERSIISAEQPLLRSIATGGSNTVHVKDTTNFNLNDTVFILNDFHPTKKADGTGFERPFQSTIISISPNSPKDIAVKQHLIITDITGNVLTLGYQDFSSIDEGNDTVGMVSVSTVTPADLTGVTTGMIVDYDQLGQGDNSNSFDTVIQSVDIINSQITVASTGNLQMYNLIDINNPSDGKLILQDVVPDTYTVLNNSKIVSNADFRLFMFHFVDHVTRDIEASQYWVHEFSFWVQVWINKLELPKISSTIDDIETTIETLDGAITITNP